MPSRNVIRQDASDSYYHVYARGASKAKIFLEPVDKSYFLRLFERYLSKEIAKNKQGFVYPKYNKQIKLLCFCLMDNHFHLLIYQGEQYSLSTFMKSLLLSYSMYFNLKYKRSGSLFESRFKSVLIDTDTYLLHISRYIHLNPQNWKRFPFSSLQYYSSKTGPNWLCTEKILALFQNRSEYLEFVEDYEENKQIREEIKHLLANS